VSGAVKDCFCVRAVVVKRGIALLPPIPDEAPPSRLGGCGLERKGRGLWSASRRERRVSKRTKRDKRMLRKKGRVCGNRGSRSVLVIPNERTKGLVFRNGNGLLRGCLHVEDSAVRGTAAGDRGKKEK